MYQLCHGTVILIIANQTRLLQEKKLIKRIHRIFANVFKELSRNSLTPAVGGEPHHLSLHDANLGTAPSVGFKPPSQQTF